MKPPCFLPPYGSPIETDFAYLAVKHLSESVDFQPQHSVDTLCGRFILDFLMTTKEGYKIGIECDGKPFHNPSRDEWRDAMILGGGYVNAIYRLRGADLTYRLEATLFLLSIAEPSFFSNRGKDNLLSLAPPCLRNIEISETLYSLTYQLISDECYEDNESWIKIYRCTTSKGSQFWKEAYLFAKSHGGGKLDSVIQAYRNQLNCETI